MVSWPQDIHRMHVKFGVHERIKQLTPDQLRWFLIFRLDFLEEELREAREAATPEDLVDAMIDLCVVAIGTLDALGVNSHEAWNRVHAANLAKEPGIKPTRPNPLGFPDLIKPPGWIAPTHADNVGLLAKIYE